MMSFTMRRENGSVTVDATDPETGFKRTGIFNSTDEALEALKEWETQEESRHEPAAAA